MVLVLLGYVELLLMTASGAMDRCTALDVCDE